MEQVVDKIILLPRFSSFAGEATFYTAPNNVRGYGEASLVLAMVGGLGTGISFVVQVQESPDLEIWDDNGPPLSITDPTDVTFRFEWMRLKIALSATDPAVTCWCVGNFVRREGA